MYLFSIQAFMKRLKNCVQFNKFNKQLTILIAIIVYAGVA